MADRHLHFQATLGRRQWLRRVTWGIAAVAAVPLAACAQPPTAPAKEAPTAGAAPTPAAKVTQAPAFQGASLKTIMTPGLVQGPWFVADQLGYFKDEGVDLTVDVGNVSATERIRLLSGNQIQLSTTTPSASTNNALERGAPIVAVANGPILNQHCPDGVFLVSEKAWNDGARSMKDLKGHKVALFIGWDGLAGRTLVLHARKAGLDPFADFEISIWNNFSDMSKALTSGQIDAMISQEPSTSSLVERAGAHPIAYVWEVLPDEPGFLIFMNANWAKDNPEGMIRVMKGYLRGIHAFNEARDSQWEKNPAVIQALAKATELDVGLIKRLQAPCFPPNGRIDLEKIDAALQYSKALGNITTLIPPSQFINQTFVEEAYRRLTSEGKI